MIRMKGGGSQPTHTTSSNVTSNLPEYARPYFEEMLGRTMYETTRPYTPYSGQRKAYFDPYESMAQEGMAQMAMEGAPSQIGSATDIATQIGYQPTGQGRDIASQYRPAPQGTDYYGGSAADSSLVGSYMNPYQQGVTDIQKREAIRDSDIQGNQMAGKAAQSGGLGGYREAIMQSERQRNLNQNLGDIQARGGLAAYQQAMQGLEGDRRSRQVEDERRMMSRQQNADLMGERTKFGFQGLGQDMAMRGQSLDSARYLGDLAKADQSMAYERLKNMGLVGDQRRGMYQDSLDMGYEDFQRQRAYPSQQLNMFNAMLQGLPVDLNAQKSTFGGPSTAAQALGAGIGAAGIWNAFR
tara:strand:- start:224 stop:1285 length:1062 start_codon:yes stop_codon:yes gene_type:complete